MITTSHLHYYLMRHIIDHGFAPTNEQIESHFNADTEQVIAGLETLQEIHGVVLHQ